MLTTDEMDGLFTEKDIAQKYLVYLQCRKCTKWTSMDYREPHKRCMECGADEYDSTSMISARTFNPLNKRKIKG